MPQGRIVGLFVTEGSTLIQILLGTDDGVAAGMSGSLEFDGRARPDAEFNLLRVSRRLSLAKVRLSIDEAKRASHVVIRPG